MIEGAAQLQAKLVRLDKGLERVAMDVARASVPDVGEAVRGSIGDLSMSNYPRRGSPMEVVGSAGRTSEGVVVEPQPRARGAMRILESGRNSYAAGDRRNSGRYVSKRTGEVRQKTRVVKRNTGATRGKGTWTEAEHLIRSRLAGRAQKALHEVMAGIFTKG